MKRIARRVAVLLLIMLPGLLGGCLGARSADEYGYVLALGVDQGEEEPYYITLLMQQTGGGESGTTAQGSVLAGAPGVSLMEALDTLGASMPFRLDFSRLSTIILSRDTAASGAAAELLTEGTLTRLKVRDNVNVAVANGLARDYIGGLVSPLAPNIAKLQDSLVKRSAETGLAPVTTLARFREGVTSKAFDPVLPLGSFDDERLDAAQLSKLGSDGGGSLSGFQQDQAGSADPAMGGLRASLRGAAIFDGDRLAGILTGEQTQLLMMGLGTFSEGRIQLPVKPGRIVTVLLQERIAPKVELALGEAPRANYTISLLARVEEETELDEAALAAGIEAYLTWAMERMFLACRDAGSDALGIGKAAVKEFDNPAAWESFDWESAYRRTEAEFTFLVAMA